ncbi:MAG: hypothetical protein CMO97_05290 [Woeseia sp.]|nr:hypothetical protein [Woeseia sp.]
MIDLENKLSEHIHYDIIPQSESEDGWDVRINEEFPETVIRFGNVKLEGSEGEEDDGYLSFNFNIVSSPDPDLTINDLTLQEYCGRILNSVLEASMSEGTVVAKDDETGEIMTNNDELAEEWNEYKSGTDDTKESVNE